MSYGIYTFGLEPFIKIEKENGNSIRVLDERFDFRTVKVKRMTTLKEYGLPENWHGGNVTKIAELQEEPFFIFVNIDNKTLDIGVKEQDVNKLNPNELNILKKKYPDLETEGKYKCKVEGCEFETDSRGLYLAHCKEHKKNN